MESRPSKYTPSIKSLVFEAAMSERNAGAMSVILAEAFAVSVKNAGLEESVKILGKTGISIIWLMIKKHLHLNKVIDGVALARAAYNGNLDEVKTAFKKLLLGGQGTAGQIIAAISEIDNGRAAMAVLRNPEYKRLLGKND